MAKLGVNIDHVATVREARKTNEPDPVVAAAMVELGGADGITFHLREDRRHIQDRDVRLLRDTVTLPLNFELACAEDVLAIACQTGPYQATLVPEKREEVTTEGGLDVIVGRERVAEAIQRLHDAGILVSLFLDPDLLQITVAKELDADAVELHTGAYAHAAKKGVRNLLPERPEGCFAQKVPDTFDCGELETLQSAAAQVVELGMTLHAGHGLTYGNTQPIAAIDAMCELNIGHTIIARAVMVGLEQAVRDMKRLIEGA